MILNVLRMKSIPTYRARPAVLDCIRNPGCSITIATCPWSGSDQCTCWSLSRCEVGTNHWIQCNDTPVKFARLPVTGLVEGRSYAFRVRAVNKSGMSRPSRTSEPVAAVDAADRARMRGRNT